MNVHAILGDRGVVARHLPGYETRPQQLAMAEAVAHALAARAHLVVEAGTGVGKSLAYLVPAILRAEVPGTNHPARQLPPAGRGDTTGGRQERRWR